MEQKKTANKQKSFADPEFPQTRSLWNLRFHIILNALCGNSGSAKNHTLFSKLFAVLFCSILFSPLFLFSQQISQALISLLLSFGLPSQKIPIGAGKLLALSKMI